MMKWARRLKIGCLGAGLAVTFNSHAEGEKFPVLNAGAQTFSNVTVISQSASDIYISHAGGFMNIKIKDLDIEAQQQLGYAAAEPEPDPSAKKSVTEAVAEQINLGNLGNLDPEIQEMQAQFTRDVVERLQGAKHLVIAILAVLAVCYIFWSYCAMLICQKAATDPGLLIWIPIFQMLPLLKAAGMPGWSFIFWLLPISCPIVSVIWCFKICQARGKHAVFGILLLLPITNIIAFLYLAFSDGEEAEQPTVRQPGELVLR